MPNSESIDKKLVIRGGEVISNDEGRLKIIFNNLISNAIRYADLAKSAPNITVQVEVTSAMLNIVFF